MIDEAAITAIVVVAQRKTNCFAPLIFRQFTRSCKEGEKALANQPMNDKRVGVFNY
jgi:hypothetical protein